MLPYPRSSFLYLVYPLLNNSNTSFGTILLTSGVFLASVLIFGEFLFFKYLSSNACRASILLNGIPNVILSIYPLYLLVIIILQNLVNFRENVLMIPRSFFVSCCRWMFYLKSPVNKWNNCLGSYMGIIP